MATEITVKMLKEMLADVPDEALIVLSRDIEGNAFSPAITYTKEAAYVPGYRPWLSGEIYTKDAPEFQHCRGRRAFVLWPMH